MSVKIFFISLTKPCIIDTETKVVIGIGLWTNEKYDQSLLYEIDRLALVAIMIEWCKIRQVVIGSDTLKDLSDR